MLPVNGPSSLLQELGRFDRLATAAQVSGLLTEPRLQANTVRLELLLHLALAYCHGKEKANRAAIHRWLNDFLGRSPVSALEDPVEDVFIGNVFTGVGNSRIFDGLWEATDFHLQLLLDAAVSGFPPGGVGGLSHEALSMLRVSDLVAERSGLSRWQHGSGQAAGEVVTPRDVRLESYARRVCLGQKLLEHHGIHSAWLAPFFLTPEAAKTIRQQTTDNSEVVRRPLIPLKDGIMLALPGAVSPAVRLRLLEGVAASGRAADLVARCRVLQGDRLFNHVLNRLNCERETYPVGLMPEKRPAFIDDVVVRFDRDKLAHVVLLHQDPYGVLRTGLAAVSKLSETEEQQLTGFLEASVSRLLSSASCKSGLTLLVCAGVGQGLMIGIRRLSESWYSMFLPLADLETMAMAEDCSMLRLWKFGRHLRRLRDAGVKVLTLASSLNTYALWRSQRYCLVQPEVPHPGTVTLAVAQDFVGPFREEVRSNVDRHAVKMESPNGYVEVVRYTVSSHFSEERAAPVYVTRRDLAAGQLWGVVETYRRPWWLCCTGEGAHSGGSPVVFQLWDALLKWMYRFVPHLDCTMSGLGARAVVIKFTFVEPDKWFTSFCGPAADRALSVVVDAKALAVLVRVAKEFSPALRGPTNAGEKMLWKAAASGVSRMAAELGMEPISEGEQAHSLNPVFDRPGAKMLHVFEARTVGDGLQPERERGASFLQPEDEPEAGLGLAWKLDPSPRQGEVQGVEECTKLCNDAVGVLWSEVSQRLRVLDRKSILEVAIQDLERLEWEKKAWERSARAQEALYGPEAERIAFEQEAKRARASQAYRTLVEMAVCEASEAGSIPTQADLDGLSAQAGLMLELAYVSDAIHFGLVKDQISVQPRGTFEYDDASLGSVCLPYLREAFGGRLEAAVRDYEQIYAERPHSQPRRGSDIWDRRMLAAFAAEHGLSLDSYIDSFAELLDLAVEKGQNVAATSGHELVARLMGNRGLSEQDARAFLRVAVLRHRPHWDHVPQGFDKRDFYPWRFRRRLSLVARPLVGTTAEEEGPILFGVLQLEASFGYMLNMIEDAWLPQEACRSSAMKQLIGAIAEEKGREFENDVGQAIRRFGWNACVGVRMSDLGAPDELGDIDVAAWASAGAFLLVIECKRLKYAKTVGEIGEQLREFQGQPKDRLGRHLARLKWLNENLSAVMTALGTPPGIREARPAIVTNVLVPMQFKNDLPIPVEQVLTVDQLGKVPAGWA